MKPLTMTRSDVGDVGQLALLTLIAWLTPPGCWRGASKATRSIGQADRNWPAYKKILARKYSESEIADIAARRRVYKRESKLQILGLNGPWRRWRPDIRLTGVAHLRNAIEGGHGTILWVTETAFSTLIVKMALHRHGVEAIQLSRPDHGFSTSPFGIRFLNRHWTRVEDRFIAERVMIAGESAADALTVLRERLAANRIVIVTVVPQAHRLVQVPFFEARLQMPTGPVRLARMAGAALLPVFTFVNSDGGFEVSIEEPLRPTDATDESVAAAYAKRLESFVLEYPDQWIVWHDWFRSENAKQPAEVRG
jgi:hypothetical protein